ncbi:MAG: amylo-alpha-1,6-glucosidase [Phycisphaerales bacterium]|jgi:hypothetical protein|nr:amylo-alpha-1,6-glucosidase [Phycisphaerales bacterium]
MNTPPHDPARAEWLLTNALGGYAMGTASTVPARRYHALLVASLVPPVARLATLAAIDECLTPIGGASGDPLRFWRFHFDGQPEPGAGPMLAAFDPPSDESPASVRWTYRWGDAGGPGGGPRGKFGGNSGGELVRTITLHDAAHPAPRVEAQGVTISYDLRLTAPARLELRPLVVMRDHHHLRHVAHEHAHDHPERHRHARHDAHALPLGIGVIEDGFDIAGDDASRTRLFIHAPGARVERSIGVWHGLRHELDAQRGEHPTEDFITPGILAWDLAPGEHTLRIIAHLGVPPPTPSEENRQRAARLAPLVSHARGGRSTDVEHALPPGALPMLVRAGDAFVVRRFARTLGEGREDRTASLSTSHSAAAPRVARADWSTSIIAGYPWFSDWGRDSMIALPGLLLATGRRDEAGELLALFARHARRGIIPNRFIDETGEPEYNTVDASLWFVRAAFLYRDACARAGDDLSRFRDAILPACVEVVRWYRDGTDFAIAMDPRDALVTAGDAHTQLTWMDAKRNGVTFTPRFGKPVEIAGLWHHALAMLSAELRGRDDRASKDFDALAQRAGESIRTLLWNERDACLFDRLEPEGSMWRAIPEPRPNQIFAAALPTCPLSTAQLASVVAFVTRTMATPQGLRTLAPGAPNYRPLFEGDLMSRDAAYHNGTAWPWMAGFLAEATLRAGNFSEESQRRALALIRPMIERALGPDAYLPGQIGECFDAEGPATGVLQRQGGCPAQAWSVAECLHVVSLCARSGA